MLKASVVSVVSGKIHGFILSNSMQYVKHVNPVTTKGCALLPQANISHLSWMLFVLTEMCVKEPEPISIISMIKERNYTHIFHVAITYFSVIKTRGHTVA
jgi:hypothetical protein